MDYIKITDYAAKDALLTGNPAKLVKGTEIGADFDAVAVAVATKIEINDALGTPTSGTLTNCTGLPAAGVVGTALVAAAIGTTVQAYDAQLADVAGLTPTDNGVIIGNGANFVVESGATLKTSLGLTIGTDVQAYDATLAGIAADTTMLSERNKVFGGDFTTNPWQRGTSFVGLTTAATYTADRFAWNNTSAAVVTITKTADAPTAAQAGVFTQHCLHVDVTTADAAEAAGDVTYIRQKIEGLNSASFGFGQAGTRYVTLSFWHKHTKTGTYCVTLFNSAINRSYVSEYTQDVTDTWEKATITIQVDTTGTWLYDTGIGLQIAFCMFSGSTFETTAGAWAAGLFFATSNQVNAMDNVANNCKFALIQLEAGQVATPFETRSFGQELALCQRYYYRHFPNVNAAQLVPSTYSFSTTVAHGSTPFPVSMRAAPTALEQSGTAADYRVLHGATTTACSAVPLFNQANTEMAKSDFTVAAGLTVGQAGCVIAAAASSAGYLGWSAEL